MTNTNYIPRRRADDRRLSFTAFLVCVYISAVIGAFTAGYCYASAKGKAMFDSVNCAERVNR